MKSFIKVVCIIGKKSPRGERALKEAIAQGFVTESGGKRSDLAVSDEKQPQKQTNLAVSDEHEEQKGPRLTISDFPTMLTWNVYHAIKQNRKAKYSWLADNLGVSERTIQRAIDDFLN